MYVCVYVCMYVCVCVPLVLFSSQVEVELIDCLVEIEVLVRLRVLKAGLGLVEPLRRSISAGLCGRRVLIEWRRATWCEW